MTPWLLDMVRSRHTCARVVLMNRPIRDTDSSSRTLAKNSASRMGVDVSKLALLRVDGYYSSQLRH